MALSVLICFSACPIEQTIIGCVQLREETKLTLQAILWNTMLIFKWFY